MFCPRCGRSMADNDRFCPECGYAVNPVAETYVMETPKEYSKATIISAFVASFLAIYAVTVILHFKFLFLFIPLMFAVRTRMSLSNAILWGLCLGSVAGIVTLYLL